MNLTLGLENRSLFNQKVTKKPLYTNSKKLKHHFGCVNAIAFNKTGSKLASGGDDRRVLIYDFDINKNQIPKSYRRHMSNIFCIEFTSNDDVYSTGNDGYLVFHDSRTSQCVVRLAHEEACHRLSVHPENDNIVLTASSDCTIKMFDRRVQNGITLLERLGRRQSYVQYNPVVPNLYISSDDRGGLFLFDARNTSEHVRKYTTRLRKKDILCNLCDITCAIWSPNGQMLATSIQRYKPTIYSIDNDDPLCLLIGNDYSAFCTTKTGGWSDISNYTYFSGGDNGFIYGWQIPDLATLTSNQTNTMQEVEEICFAATEYNTIPMQIENSYFLYSGESIINSVACHPTLPYLAACGVEKHVTVHCDHELDDEIKIDAVPDSRTLEDEETISFFDNLLRSEKRFADDYLWNEPQLFRFGFGSEAEQSSDDSHSFDDVLQ